MRFLRNCKGSLTSAHVCKGPLYIYQTVCKLWSPECLLQLHHTPHRRFTSQHTARPVLTRCPCSLNDWKWMLERVMGGQFKKHVIYQWQWCGCHQSQNHWGRRSGSPEPAIVAIWPPNLSWLVGGLEFPFLLSPWKSVQFSQLVRNETHSLSSQYSVTHVMLLYLKLAFHFVPVMFKRCCPLHCLVFCLKSALLFPQDLLVCLLQSLGHMNNND